MNHPEFVYSHGIRFLSRWAERSLRDQLDEAERTLKDIADGRVPGEDAAMAARRALDEISRLSRF